MAQHYCLKAEIQVSVNEPFRDKEEVREFLRDRIEENGEICIEVLNFSDEITTWEDE
jgi:hypothetical protein